VSDIVPHDFLRFYNPPTEPIKVIMRPKIESPEPADPPAVTELFFMYENPVHPGAYKLARIDGSEYIYCYWDGKMWCGMGKTPQEAFQRPFKTRSIYRNWRVIGWRGLAERTIDHAIDETARHIAEMCGLSVAAVLGQ
jgi:hypothetical protein